MTGRIDLTKNMVSISMRMKDKKTGKKGDNPILTFLRYQSGRKVYAPEDRYRCSRGVVPFHFLWDWASGLRGGAGQANYLQLLIIDYGNRFILGLYRAFSWEKGHCSD